MRDQYELQVLWRHQDELPQLQAMVFVLLSLRETAACLMLTLKVTATLFPKSFPTLHASLKQD
jgi:hypothetical protein